MAYPLLLWSKDAMTSGTATGWSLAATGCNLAHIRIGAMTPSDSYYTEQLRQAGTKGARVVLHFEFSDEQHLVDRIRYYKNWTNVYAYCLADEPDLQTGKTPALISRLHAAAQAEDSTRPTMITSGFGTKNGAWTGYIGKTNLIVFDRYWRQTGLAGSAATEITNLKDYLTLADTAYTNASLSTSTCQMGVFMQAFVETDSSKGLPTSSEYADIADHVLAKGSRWGMFGVYAWSVSGSSRIYPSGVDSNASSLRTAVTTFTTAYSGSGSPTWPVTTLSGWSHYTGAYVPMFQEPGSSSTPALTAPVTVTVRQNTTAAVTVSGGTAPYTYTWKTTQPTGTTVSSGVIYAGGASGTAVLRVNDSAGTPAYADVTISVVGRPCE